MRPGGRLQAAIEVLDDVLTHHRPAHAALADWGRSHRFAGAGDRAAIGNLVYDALRKRASIAARMGEDSPRALALGCLVEVEAWGMAPEEVASLADGSRFAPAPLSEAEKAALARALPADTEPHIRANVPAWLWPSFERAFEEEAMAEGAALAARPPLDLRVNPLKATREKVLRALAQFGSLPTPISPQGVRIAPTTGPARSPAVKAEAAYRKGWLEVQDEASQVVAALVFARPGEQVLDYCAGAGGKTLALAAAMANRGQIYAYDSDRARLAPIYERLQRAGVRNVQVRPPAEGALDDLVGRMHRVLVDAPCSGSGVWRRRPEAKWRLTPEALAKRISEQRSILESAANYVRPGGYLCYVTCSLLPEENEDQVQHFLARHPDYELVSAEEAWRELFGLKTPRPWSHDGMSLVLTPAATQTDGFYFAVMERRDAP